MKKYLEKLFEENDGYLTAEKMRGSTLRYHLNKMIASGEVIKVRHGLYLLSRHQVFDERILIAEMIPGGIFCLFTAWQLHELTTTVSHQYHVALPRTTKIKPPAQPPVALYYLSDAVYRLGVSEFQIDGKAINCYNKERSVCDAVKFRNKTGEDIMQEVLKNYMNSNNRNLDQLLKYAKTLRIEKVIMPYIKSLI